MATLPHPSFSPSNPYWRPVVIPGVLQDFQPLKSAEDYAYATTWELQRIFRQPKLCLLVRRVSGPLWRYLWYMNFRKFWAEHVQMLRKSKAAPFSKEEKSSNENS